MKLLESFNIHQIVACGKIISRLEEKGESLEKFAEFTRSIMNTKMIARMLHFKLSFVVDKDKELSNRDFLLALGYGNVKAFQKLRSIISKRLISEQELKECLRELRKYDFEKTSFGKVGSHK